jgi:hypothetical protein
MEKGTAKNGDMDKRLFRNSFASKGYGLKSVKSENHFQNLFLPDGKYAIMRTPGREAEADEAPRPGDAPDSF